MKARSYQDESVNALFEFFGTHETGNPVLGLPTGTGKSLVIALFLMIVLKRWPTQRIMMVTHVKELIEQNHEKFKIIWPDAPSGIYSSGLNRKDISSAAIFAGIQSVAKKAVIFGHIDLVVIDECHLVSPAAEASYGAFLEDLKLINPNLRVIGLTATPYRLGLGLITNGQIFTDICYDKTQGDDFVWFVTEGYLSKLVPRPTKTQFDLSGVRMQGGEFKAGDSQEAMDKEAITREAIVETVHVAGELNKLKWMFFTTGIDHCEHVADMLRQYDIDTRVVHSRMGSDELRAANVQWFKDPCVNGKPKALVNVDTLTTGFDCTDLDLLAILRPTMSPGLWVQILGRGTRPHYAPGFDLTTREGRLAAIQAGGKPNCMVLDFAGNTARLGPINRVQVPPPPGQKKNSAPPAKICPADCEDPKGNKGCGCYIWAASLVCEHCGYEFPPPKHKLTAAASSETLIAGVDEQFDIRELDVGSVTYSKHVKRSNKTESLKVTYLCGLLAHTEYVSIEGKGNARSRAERWWMDRTHGLLPPNTVDEALHLAKQGILAEPKKITVRFDTQYPQILRAFNYEHKDRSERKKEHGSAGVAVNSSNGGGLRPIANHNWSA